MPKREWTPEQKAALRKRLQDAKEKKRAAANPGETPAKPITIGKPSETEVETLRREMAELRSELGLKNKALIEAKASAQAAAASATLMGAPSEEVPVPGEFKMVDTLDEEEPFKVTGHKEDGREILRPNFTGKKKEPAYYYLIDLPTVGFSKTRPPCISINGREYEHGRVYKFTMPTLQTVKSLVYQSWAHERDLHRDTNVYRKPVQVNAAAPGALDAAIAEQQSLRSA